MNIRGYEIEVEELRAELGGGFIAFAPQLSGCASDGESPAAAILNLEDAIASWLDAARVAGRVIPEPGLTDAL